MWINGNIKKLKDKIYVEQIVGSDIFKHKYKSNKILYIDNNKLFKKMKNLTSFIVDVLHHIGIDEAPKIIKKLSKLSCNIIIKTTSNMAFSRQLLRFVDFYANYGYGVNVPKKYFDKVSYKVKM